MGFRLSLSLLFKFFIARNQCLSKLFVLVEGRDHQLLISTMLVKVLEIFEVASHFGVGELECDGVTCGVAQMHTYQGAHCWRREARCW